MAYWVRMFTIEAWLSATDPWVTAQLSKQQMNPRVGWSASLQNLESSRLREGWCVKRIKCRLKEQDLKSSSGLHMCLHPHPCMSTYATDTQQNSGAHDEQNAAFLEKSALRFWDTLQPLMKEKSQNRSSICCSLSATMWTVSGHVPATVALPWHKLWTNKKLGKEGWGIWGQEPKQVITPILVIFSAVCHIHAKMDR